MRELDATAQRGHSSLNSAVPCRAAPLTYTTPHGRIANVSCAVLVELETDPCLKGVVSTGDGIACADPSRLGLVQISRFSGRLSSQCGTRHIASSPCAFASRTGRTAAVGALADLERIARGEAGTSVTVEAQGLELY